jgi:hypothetical protein
MRRIAVAHTGFDAGHPRPFIQRQYLNTAGVLMRHHTHEQLPASGMFEQVRRHLSDYQGDALALRLCEADPVGQRYRQSPSLCHPAGVSHGKHTRDVPLCLSAQLHLISSA